MVTQVADGDRPVHEVLNARFQELADTVAILEAAVPSGTILGWATNSAPVGWLACDGAAVARATYADLFALIGTTYGVGDGSTTFNLPDLKGRFPMGAGTGSGLTARTLGQAYGSDRHILTLAEIPSHLHLYPFPYHSASGGLSAGGGVHHIRFGTGVNTSSAGSDSPHENMQPLLATNWIIKT